MIYFDWRHSLRLGRYKQLIWTFLHFPFHLGLRIFLEGSTQFVTWWKVLETIDSVSNQLSAALESWRDSDQVTTQSFIDQITNTINDVFNVYVPKYAITSEDISRYLTQINETVPDSWWTAEVEGPIESDPIQQALEGILEKIGYALGNSLLAGFKIDGFSGFTNTTASTSEEYDKIEMQVSEINAGKFDLVFKYAFIAAGITLILMNILSIITSPRKWTLWNYINKTINFLVGIVLCLMALITLDAAKYETFSGTPWPLPTILLAFFTVLLIHHLPRPPPVFFGGKKKAGRKPNTEGWEAVRVGYRDKGVDETSVDRGSGQGPETPGPQVVDTSYQGGGGRP
jgi:hypothetical protein